MQCLDCNCHWETFNPPKETFSTLFNWFKIFLLSTNFSVFLFDEWNKRLEPSFSATLNLQETLLVAAVHSIAQRVNRQPALMVELAIGRAKSSSVLGATFGGTTESKTTGICKEKSKKCKDKTEWKCYTGRILFIRHAVLGLYGKVLVLCCSMSDQSRSRCSRGTHYCQSWGMSDAECALGEGN